MFKTFKTTSLHGQTKDALSKTKLGGWEYDIVTDGFKCNMTDMSAAIGLVQLTRYEDMLRKRANIFNTYTSILKDHEWAIIPPSKNDEGTESSYHLYTLRIKGFNEPKRNLLIQRLSELGIGTNVHYKPLPMLTLYKNLGLDIKDYPNAYAQYENEITLPVYTTLKLEDAEYIANEVVKIVNEIK